MGRRTMAVLAALAAFALLTAAWGQTAAAGVIRSITVQEAAPAAPAAPATLSGSLHDAAEDLLAFGPPSADEAAAGAAAEDALTVHAPVRYLHLSWAAAFPPVDSAAAVADALSNVLDGFTFLSHVPDGSVAGIAALLPARDAGGVRNQARRVRPQR